MGSKSKNDKSENDKSENDKSKNSTLLDIVKSLLPLVELVSPNVHAALKTFFNLNEFCESKAVTTHTSSSSEEDTPALGATPPTSSETN